MKTNKCVLQGCILSYILFDIYSEDVFKAALDQSTEEIQVCGETINNIRYAEDTVIIGSS